MGGLFTAPMVRLKGWDVDVYDRTPVKLTGRGADIVTHEPLLEELRLCGASTKNQGFEI